MRAERWGKRVVDPRWGAVAFLAMTGMGLVGCAPRADRGIAMVKAQTVYGSVAGKVRSPGVIAFLGVPFARAPTGPLRFKPPQSPQPWSGVREAFEFGPSCPQLEDPFEPASRRTKSEDCLHLNVWTPAADNARRPVIVWIHGGGFINGGTADPMYDGTTFARNGNLVFVSFNYRVGVLGWLYLGHIDPNYADSGNLGLLDQVAGLRWIRDNIAHFGGDPGNVTLMGESAGAGSATTLMATPAAKGLFHKVIAQSGSPSFCRDIPTAIEYANRFLAIAGTNEIDRLREIPAASLLRCYASFESKEGLNASRALGPVVGDPVLPIHPCAAIAQGQAAGIRLLHGTNRDEVKYWIMYFLPFNWWSPERVLERYAEALRLLKDKATAREIIAYYRKKMRGSRDGDISHAMFTDVFFWIPAVQLAEAQARHGETWMYQFTWPSPVWFGLFGSHHALELPFVFDNFDAPWAKEIVGSRPPRELAELMQNAWIAFARRGTPQHAGIPNWPPYRITDPPPNRRATMFFDVRPGPVVRYDPAPDIRELYKGILY